MVAFRNAAIGLLRLLGAINIAATRRAGARPAFDLTALGLRDVFERLLLFWPTRLTMVVIRPTVCAGMVNASTRAE